MASLCPGKLYRQQTYNRILIGWNYYRRVLCHRGMLRWPLVRYWCIWVITNPLSSQSKGLELGKVIIDIILATVYLRLGGYSCVWVCYTGEGVGLGVVRTVIKYRIDHWERLLLRWTNSDIRRLVQNRQLLPKEGRFLYTCLPKSKSLVNN